MPMPLDFMPGFWALVTEREEMPTWDSPLLTGRAKARLTVRPPWPLREAANQAPNTDMLLRPWAEDRATLAGRVMVVVWGMAVVKVEATAAATVVAAAETMAVVKVEARAAPSNRK